MIEKDLFDYQDSQAPVRLSTGQVTQDIYKSQLDASNRIASLDESFFVNIYNQMINHISDNRGHILRKQ